MSNADAADRLARIRAYADDHHDGECRWASDVMTLADGGWLPGEPRPTTHPAPKITAEWSSPSTSLTKSERRKARKMARREGRSLEGKLALDRPREPVELSETARGYRARERWARHYDALNGAPESDYDR